MLVLKKCLYCGSKFVASEKAKHGMHESCFAKCFSLKIPDEDFANLSIKHSSKAPEVEKGISNFNNSFFHGAFKKYSAEIGGKQYILKMQQTDYLELPEVEWISNKIFSILGINVAEFSLINYDNQLPTFVTKNFIGKRSASNLIHIYHFLKPDQKFDCENLLAIIFQNSGKLFDIKCFIEMVIADSLIGNHDRHGRNIALIQSGPSKFQLSPIYDNPSYIGMECEILLGADLNPTGKICTQCSNEPTLKNYISEFKRLGHIEIVEAFIEKILQSQTKILKIIDSSSISEKRKMAFIQLINKRIGEI